LLLWRGNNATSPILLAGDGPVPEEAVNDLTQAMRMICSELSTGNTDAARSVAREHYPLPSFTRHRRAYTPLDLTRTAIRDGFLDRYSGRRLVFPGVLRLLSELLPEELPYHTNWAYDKCHPMFWELYPTLDHVVPIARGGTDTPDNWVVTSQQMNSAKAHWTLEELRWTMVSAGSLKEWDGLLSWFVEFTDTRRELVAAHRHVSSWRAVALKCSVDAAR
jgi:hypothetical protein